MRKYKKSELILLIYLLCFCFTIITTSFIPNILGNYTTTILLIIYGVIFYFVLIFEKDKSRYKLATIYNILMFCIAFLCLYYLMGLIIGFAKVANYYNLYGLFNFIIPVVINIILKEILRYQIIRKGENHRFLIFLGFLTFFLLDICMQVKIGKIDLKSAFSIYALTFLPSLSTNILCTYVAIKAGYKPNIVYNLIMTLYLYLIPIVPNANEYVASIINFCLPLVLFYRLKRFFTIENDNLLDRNYNKKRLSPYAIPIILTVFLVYFISGYFTYYMVTIGSGSMIPAINIGDAVIIKQKHFDFDEIKEGDVVAYKYQNVVIVHRVVKILTTNGERYYYTKGDNNGLVDNWNVKDEDIIGVVKLKVPCIGVPTIWLNNLKESGE